MLEGARDAERGDLALPRVGHRSLAEKEIAPGVAGSAPVIEIEYRALAGAVRTDQPDDLAGLDFERYIFDRLKAAEALARALYLQQRSRRSSG